MLINLFIFKIKKCNSFLFLFFEFFFFLCFVWFSFVPFFFACLFGSRKVKEKEKEKGMKILPPTHTKKAQLCKKQKGRVDMQSEGAGTSRVTVFVISIR